MEKKSLTQTNMKEIEKLAETNTDCRTEEGIIVGLIDALISVARVLSPKLNNSSEAIHEALKDLHNDEDLLKILRFGPHNINLKRSNNNDLLNTLSKLNTSKYKLGHEYFHSLKRSEHFPVSEAIPKAVNFGYKKAMEAQRQPAMSLEELREKFISDKGFSCTDWNDFITSYDPIEVDYANKSISELYANQFSEDQKWVSVETPPIPDTSFVLVYAGVHKIVLIMWYGLDNDGNNKWFYKDEPAKKHLQPIGWQPLPSPPNKEG